MVKLHTNLGIITTLLVLTSFAFAACAGPGFVPYKNSAWHHYTKDSARWSH